MPEIQIFKFKNNQLRSMIDAHGEPWFVAKDACDILAVETNHLRRDLDSDEITEATNLPNWGGWEEWRSCSPDRLRAGFVQVDHAQPQTGG